MQPTQVMCQRCGDPMQELETIKSPGQGPTIVMFECPREGCSRRAALMFEPDGGMTDAQATWVERIVAEKGAFFPTDWTGGGPRR